MECRYLGIFILGPFPWTYYIIARMVRILHASCSYIITDTTSTFPAYRCSPWISGVCQGQKTRTPARNKNSLSSWSGGNASPRLFEEASHEKKQQHMAQSNRLLLASVAFCDPIPLSEWWVGHWMSGVRPCLLTCAMPTPWHIYMYIMYIFAVRTWNRVKHANTSLLA